MTAPILTPTTSIPKESLEGYKAEAIAIMEAIKNPNSTLTPTPTPTAIKPYTGCTMPTPTPNRTPTPTPAPIDPSTQLPSTSNGLIKGN